MTYIELTQGKRALIDDEDYERVKPYHWIASHNGGTRWQVHAVVGRKDGKTIYAHLGRFLMGVKSSAWIVKHKNGDRLDFRKENLVVLKVSFRNKIRMIEPMKSETKGTLFLDESHTFEKVVEDIVPAPKLESIEE